MQRNTRASVQYLVQNYRSKKDVVNKMPRYEVVYELPDGGLQTVYDSAAGDPESFTHASRKVGDIRYSAEYIGGSMCLFIDGIAKRVWAPNNNSKDNLRRRRQSSQRRTSSNSSVGTSSKKSPAELPRTNPSTPHELPNRRVSFGRREPLEHDAGRMNASSERRGFDRSTSKSSSNAEAKTKRDTEADQMCKRQLFDASTGCKLTARKQVAAKRATNAIRSNCHHTIKPHHDAKLHFGAVSGAVKSADCHVPHKDAIYSQSLLDKLPHPAVKDSATKMFEVDQLVEVAETTGPGKRLGGTARVECAYEDGTFDVRYVINGGRERRVFADRIVPFEEAHLSPRCRGRRDSPKPSDSKATPSAMEARPPCLKKPASANSKSVHKRVLQDGETSTNTARSAKKGSPRLRHHASKDGRSSCWKLAIPPGRDSRESGTCKIQTPQVAKLQREAAKTLQKLKHSKAHSELLDDKENKLANIVRLKRPAGSCFAILQAKKKVHLAVKSSADTQPEENTIDAADFGRPVPTEKRLCPANVANHFTDMIGDDADLGSTAAVLEANFEARDEVPHAKVARAAWQKLLMLRSDARGVDAMRRVVDFAFRTIAPGFADKDPWLPGERLSADAVLKELLRLASLLQSNPHHLGAASALEAALVGLADIRINSSLANRLTQDALPRALLDISNQEILCQGLAFLAKFHKNTSGIADLAVARTQDALGLCNSLAATSQLFLRHDIPALDRLVATLADVAAHKAGVANQAAISGLAGRTAALRNLRPVAMLTSPLDTLVNRTIAAQLQQCA